MNWKEEVAEKLRRYPAMSHAVVAMDQELKLLEQEACAVQAARTDRQGRGSVRGYEDRLLNILVRRRELEQRLTATGDWLRLVDTSLGQLSQAQQQLLAGLYIKQLPVSRLCQQLGMEKSSLYRHRDRALTALTLCMYGAPES